MAPDPGRVVLARPSTGGAGYVAERVSGQLRAAGWQVLDITVANDSRPAIAALRATLANREALREADVLHVELGALDLGVWWFGLFAARINRHLVLMAHDAPAVISAPAMGLLGWDRRWASIVGHRILTPLLDRLLRRLLARSVRVGVVLTEAVRADWATRAPHPIVATDLGADPPLADAPAPSRGEYVLCAGFIGPSKGVDVLLDAWQLLGSDVPLPLLIAGVHTGGPLGERYEAGLRERAAAMVRPPQWLGWLSDDELTWRIAHAAIFVLPYRRSNPASGVVVRAMVEGRAIVATAVPAALDAIRDREEGLIVPPDDERALAEAIRRLLRDPALRDRLGAAARERAAARFTWQSHLSGLAAAYAVARVRS